MGYLSEITRTLSFCNSRLHFNYIKEHGVVQFLLLYKACKNLYTEETFWGDEIEMHILNIDPVTKLPRLQLNNQYIINSVKSSQFEIQPESGAWMIETVPRLPYRFTGDPNVLLESYTNRCNAINSHCKDGDVLFAGVSFPLLGVGDFFIPKMRGQYADVLPKGTVEEKEEEPSWRKKDNVKHSPFKEELLNPHPRYPTMNENIPMRRGEDLRILVPIYPDEKTSMEKTEEEPFSGFIHMNDVLYGTGNTSLQLTFGTKNAEEARYLHDQLAVVSSILLPLSAASAVFKGKLANVDIRWSVLKESVDCRTKEERKANHRTRWAPISRYLSLRPECKDKFNDVHSPINKEILQYAMSKAKELKVDIDEKLLHHIGFLFVQDPLIVFPETLETDDTTCTNHFESIQSTNWNNVRLKPPPGFNSEIGWRVELRTMEAQLKPEESVGYSMFSYFMMEMLTKKGYNFYIPISKLDENFERAHTRDGVITEKFWFRKDIARESADEWVELTLDEILHGKANTFVGLFNLVFDYCREQYGVDMQAEWANKKKNPDAKLHKIAENMKYFEILSKRARGETPTIANWIRNFVLNHGKYRKDSIVTPEIASDLILAMNDISNGKKDYADFM